MRSGAVKLSDRVLGAIIGSSIGFTCITVSIAVAVYRVRSVYMW